MRIEYKFDNMFDSGANVLINPVNTKGIMGAGLAAQFRQRYPAMFRAYVQACKDETCAIGKCFDYTDESGVTIINFPTKDHWKDPSTLEYIRLGMRSLVAWINNQDTTFTIAIPALGSGLGSLSWCDVQGIITKELDDDKIVASKHIFYIYPPQ